MRRVGRVDAVRADPIGALVSRDDTPAGPLPFGAPLGADEPAVDEPAVDGVPVMGDAPAGAPQTLQYPESISPGQPGWVHFWAVMWRPP
jgi:hypothetical protein